jgi:hypothetical protein
MCRHARRGAEQLCSTAMTEPLERVPQWAEALVRLLDDGFRIPGTQLRIGADALLGALLPVGGDALGALGTLSLFGLAAQQRVPRVVLARMALNVAIDALVGSVPVLGDVFDLFWKANRKNLALIERSAQTQRRGGSVSWRDRLFLVIVLLLVCCALALPMVVFGLLLHALFASQ